MGIFSRFQIRRIYRTLVAKIASSGPLKAWVLAFASQGRVISKRTNLEELDTFLNQAQNLQDWLDHPKWIEQYCSGLRSYFGEERFHKESFDAILSQLKEVVQKVPGFAESVWADSDPSNRRKFFDIETTHATSGTELNLRAWKVYRFQWLAELRLKAGLKWDDSNIQMLSSRARDYFSNADQKIETFESELGFTRKQASEGKWVPLSKKEKKFRLGKFYESIHSEIKCKHYGALVLYLFLVSQENARFFQLSGADAILEYMRELRQNPKQVANIFKDISTSRSLLAQIRVLIPGVSELLKNSQMFRPIKVKNLKGKYIPIGSSSQALYRTRSIRPFHSIWFGISTNDCLGGDPFHLSTLTPRRWAVGVLDGAQTVVIERNDHYQGYARCVPVCTPNGLVYGSLEIWTPTLLSRIGVDQSLFGIWFPEFSKQMPSFWKGIVLSESKLIDNSGVKLSVAQSSFFENASLIGDAETLSYFDPKAELISKAIEVPQIELLYGNKMFFDAMIKDAGQLHAFEFEINFHALKKVA